MPGPIERILREIGVTSNELLSRSKALDNATCQLINQAAEETAPYRWHAAVRQLSASADTAQIIEHVLAHNYPRAAAVPSAERSADHPMAISKQAEP
jgi:hypothetical protein